MKRISLPLALRALVFAAALAVFGPGHSPAIAADAPSAAEKERQLIGVLKTDAPPSEKAITCKRLAIYGSKEAVPALAPLLANPELASWARIALEAIPDPTANDALMEAARSLEGKLLIGAINSLAVRRDPRSVAVLLPPLKSADKAVAAAAAEALGHFGGPEATAALEAAMKDDSAALRSAAAYGAVMCAEHFLASGNAIEATRIYDAVRNANVPGQRRLEATRGAILARKSEGIPLLIEQLKSTDKELFHAALGTSREIKDPRVSEALVAEMKKASGDRQVILLIALSDRRDPSTEGAVLEVAGSGSKPARLAAVGVLSQVARVSSIPTLLTVAADPDAEVAKAARTALVRMENPAVDADLLARLPTAEGPTRQVLAEVAGQRRLGAAVPSLMAWLEAPDAGLRQAALQAVGSLGDERQAGRLAERLAKAPAGPERQQVMRSLTSIAGRAGARCTPSLLPLMRSNDTALRLDALHLLAAVGGTDALNAVVAAVDDPVEDVQDDAVSTLATWPNNWPDDTSVAGPLLKLASSGKKLAHQVQGIRGYLDYVQEASNLTPPDKVTKVKDLMPLLKRPEEKRLAVAALSAIPTTASLETLVAITADSEVTEEACLAIVNLNTGRKLLDTPRDLRQASLRLAGERAKTEGTRKKAQEALQRVN